jgi:hypothetical protein
MVDDHASWRGMDEGVTELALTLNRYVYIMAIPVLTRRAADCKMV